MIARDALLLPPGCGEGHRGIWFYDPTVYGEIKTGDRVIFHSGGEEVAKGVVTADEQMPSGDMPEDFRKYCSRVNGKVFFWSDEPSRGALYPRSSPLVTPGH